MDNDFNLSKEIRPSDHKEFGECFIFAEDVKRFIELLKKEIPKLKSEGYYDCCNDEDFFKLIDKIAGKDLIK